MRIHFRLHLERLKQLHFLPSRGLKRAAQVQCFWLLFAYGLTWCALSGAVLWRPASAQEPPIPAGQLRADAAFADVYLNDSFEALDDLARAIKLASAGRWTEAAELLQKTSDSAPDKLVKIGPGQYVGIRQRVGSIVSEWPEPGLAAYRSLYERRVVEALHALGDSREIEQLLPLYQQYFCTSAAAKLADTIAQLAIESGDLSLADRVYSEVITAHPDRVAYGPRYRAMLSVLNAIRGESKSAIESSSSEIGKLRWLGQERPIEEIVLDSSLMFSALHEKGDPNEWPIFGGEPARNRRSSTRVDELGLLWRYQLPEFSVKSAQKPTRGNSQVVVSGRAIMMNPVAAGSLLFAQRGREIIAFHRNSGVTAWRFGGPDGSPRADETDDQPPGWDPVTVHDGQVFATLPANGPPYAFDASLPGGELVCLRADTGRLIWRVDRDTFPEERTEASFDSSPVVRSGKLFVVARRRRSFSFEDCYLYRFNAENGSFEFRTHLGSASTGSFASRQPTTAMAAVQGDTVYVCTNLGSIVAVSVHTGAIRWLRLYRRDRIAAGATGGGGREARAWGYNPILYEAGKLYCLPTDANQLWVLKAANGEIVHSIATDQMNYMETLLGVHDEVLCGTGKGAACYDLTSKRILWSTALEGLEMPFGRGTWAEDHLIVPTPAGLLFFGAATGDRRSVPWDPEGESGNILALPDQLLVSGPSGLSVFVRKSDIWASLRSKMLATPNDPKPALELAEVALRSGEFADALDAFDEAVQRTGGLAEPADSSLERRIYDDAVMFAESLANRSQLSVPVLEKLFGYASRYSPDTEAHLAYRLRFAEFFAGHGFGERAVNLYQQIIRDRSLRDLSVTAVSGDPKAAVEAQRRITRLIEQHGPIVYAAHDAEANELFESGKANSDIEALSRIVETFPNSRAAPLALQAQADLFATRGRFQEAAHLYVRAYQRLRGEGDTPSLLRKTADAYERAGQSNQAYRWLTKGAVKYPRATLEHQGRGLSFLDYRARLVRSATLNGPPLPRLEPPLTLDSTRELEPQAALMIPVFDGNFECSWSRFFVSTADGIRAFDSRSQKELWPSPAPTKAEAKLLLATDDLTLFTTGYEVFALDPLTGQRRWSHGEYPKRVDNPQADWEDGQTIRAHALANERFVGIREGGTIFCLNTRSGGLVWSHGSRPVPSGGLTVSDRILVYPILREGRTVLMPVDLATGASLSPIVTEEERTAENLFITLDEQIILVTSQSISSYDLETSERRWRVVFDGRIRQPSVVLDDDAIFCSPDGRKISKFSLEDGRLMWDSDRVVPRGDQDVTVLRLDGQLIVSTLTSVAAVESVTGQLLWQGTTPDRPRFTWRGLANLHVIALDVPGEAREASASLYFYDQRDASGSIPKDGGAKDLGRLTEIRNILAVDGAFLIQTGSTLRIWTNP